MRTLIRNQDLKTLFAGAAFAVGLGLIGGAAMQPNLFAGEGPQGPQMLAGESGRRVAPEDNPYAVYASYPQTLPDYVIGSDWVKPRAEAPPLWDDEAFAVEDAAAPAYAIAEAPEAPTADEAPVAPEAPVAQDEAAELEELAVATPG